MKMPRVTLLIKRDFICLCLPPEGTWHKINDPRVVLKWGLGEGKVGHEPRVEPCWDFSGHRIT